MPTFTIELCPGHAQQLRAIAERDGTSPDEALLAHIQEWLESEVTDVSEPGVIPAPPGMFPDDGCEYSFFDPAQADPSRAEDFLTPEQRLDAIAEILATIALRAIKQDKEAESAEPVGDSEDNT